MGTFLTNIDSARRSIRNIWQKDLYHFRTNHPFFILIFIAAFVCFYNLWWQYAPEGKEQPREITVYDNFRLSKHKFVKMMICIPPNVVDYRFSTVPDAIHLTHLDYPELEFTKDLKKARQRLENREVEILILFTKMIETGKEINYNIISQNGVLNKEYCAHCDSHRKETWGNAVESQVIVNRFLYWLARSRGFSHRKPHWQLSNIYIKGTFNDAMYSKKQADLFITWIVLLPICARLIDLWNDDRKSGFYKTFLSIHGRRYEYFIAKFVFWYGISLIIGCCTFASNVLIVPSSFNLTYLPFVICYIGCITTFTIFLASLFPGTPFFAKFVGMALMAVGEFGFGTIYHGVGFFQLSIRHFGRAEGDGYWIDAVCLMCMAANSILMISISIYLDTFFFSYTPEPLSFYFPLERAYWMPSSRLPSIDKHFLKQIVHSKMIIKEVPKKKVKGMHSPKNKHSVPMKKDVIHHPKKPQNAPFVVLYGVCKSINNNWKVNQLSVTCRIGEIVTFYGYHGCGSEEILSMLNGKMKPDYGDIMMEQSQRPLLISSTTDIPIIDYMNVTEYLEFVSRMRGIDLSIQFLTEIFDELDLLKVQDRTLDILSTTQKERLRIAAAFVGHPDVILIDWPTRESLPEWKFMILRFIEKRKEKRSIIISSYDPEETEAISDKIVLLSEGYVVLNGLAERFKQPMDGVFEIRLWPLTGFTNEQIRGIIGTLTLGDVQMRKDTRYIETPNGKLRIMIPVIYRRSIPLILRELEAVAEQNQLAFYELSKPNLHDIYTNSCYERHQYEPLINYGQLREYYSKQETVSPNGNIFKNMMRVVKDKQVLFQSAAIFGFFLILGALTVFAYLGIHRTYSHEISLESHDLPITIFCDECEKVTSDKVTYLKRGDTNQLAENEALFYWKRRTLKADLELFSVSRGDDIFTLIIQNYAISQVFARVSGRYPSITPSLESREFRHNRNGNGFSMVFNDVTQTEAFTILSESYALMYTFGVFQTFLYAISALIPMRFVSVNMRQESIYFSWPRHLYYGFIFVINLLIFLVLSIVLILIPVVIGFFPTDTETCFFQLFGAWFLSYSSTLPLIYLLVFSVRNPEAIIPTVIAVSSFFVFIPIMISSYSIENQISVYSILQFISWICMISPPTSFQVLVSFLSSQDPMNENNGTINSLILFCGAQFWIIIVFSICIFQPGFSILRQYWFIFSTAVFSIFETGTTLKPGARLKNSFLFANNGTVKNLEINERPSNTDSRSTAGGDEYTKLNTDYIAGSSSSNEDMSYITNYEEYLTEKMASMKKWDDRQEVPVDNSSTFLLGDYAKLNSSLLKTITETNQKEQFAYVPIVECLPTLYTPIELLENVASSRGYEISEGHINYLLNTFNLKSCSTTPISLLSDTDRRILMLISQFVTKPSVIIIDQLELFIPHSKMMTMWSLFSRFRSDGIGIIYTSSQKNLAEHTASNCAHMYKCSFISTLPPSTIKTRMGSTVLEIVPKAGIDSNLMLKMLQLSMKEASQIPSTARNISLILRKDDVETIELILGVVRALSNSIQRYHIRSGNFDEFVASSFGK